jgi:hypothetical protein
VLSVIHAMQLEDLLTGIDTLPEKEITTVVNEKIVK